MRNDARPVGEHAAGHSTLSDRGENGEHDDRATADGRDSVKHDRQSHVVNRGADADAGPAPDDPVMGPNESSMNTKI